MFKIAKESFIIQHMQCIMVQHTTLESIECVQLCEASDSHKNLVIYEWKIHCRTGKHCSFVRLPFFSELFNTGFTFIYLYKFNAMNIIISFFVMAFHSGWIKKEQHCKRTVNWTFFTMKSKIENVLEVCLGSVV